MDVVQKGSTGAVHNRDALQTSIREAAAKAQELQRQAEGAQASLEEATARVMDLVRQAAAAQQMITAYQEQEGVIGRALADAERASEQILLAAKAKAEEMVAAARAAAEETVTTARATAHELVTAAQATAEGTVTTARAAGDEIVRSARATAEETLQQARESAQEQVQAAERITAAAKAAADEILQSTRATADETLERARASAQDQLQAAERAGAEHLARVRAESDRLMEDTTHKVDEINRSAEQYVAGVAAKLEAFIVDREGVSRGLEALVKKQMDSLQAFGRLRSEVKDEILPVLTRLMRGLRGDAVTDVAAGAPVSVGDAPPADEATTPASEAVFEEERPPLARHTGEITVSPIHSFLQATKFMSALTHIKGVTSVKLRSYSGSKAVIDLVTEGLTVAGIDSTRIDGFQVEVVESTDSHLALRIASSAARPVAG